MYFFNFTAVPGINLPIPRNATPLQYFELFMTMSVWQYIMQTTNQYARVRLGSMPPTRRSVFRNWRDITLVEMKAFVGVIIQMGFVQLTQIKDYWSTHVTLNLPFFRSVFSRDRFLQIFWMLHVYSRCLTCKSVSAYYIFLCHFQAVGSSCFWENKGLAIRPLQIKLQFLITVGNAGGRHRKYTVMTSLLGHV